MQDFIAQLSQQWLQLPDCQIESRDTTQTRITSSAAAGAMEIELFVHHGGGYSATRYEPSMVLDAEHRLHAWITLRDAGGAVIHHEVTCNLQRVSQLLQEWRTVPEAAPAQLTIKTIADRTYIDWY